MTHDTAHTELGDETGPCGEPAGVPDQRPSPLPLIREITWSAIRSAVRRWRIYRMLPWREHEGHWHDDALDGRMLT